MILSCAVFLTASLGAWEPPQNPGLIPRRFPARVLPGDVYSKRVQGLEFLEVLTIKTSPVQTPLPYLNSSTLKTWEYVWRLEAINSEGREVPLYVAGSSTAHHMLIRELNPLGEEPKVIADGPNLWEIPEPGQRLIVWGSKGADGVLKFLNMEVPPQPSTTQNLGCQEEGSVAVFSMLPSRVDAGRLSGKGFARLISALDETNIRGMWGAASLSSRIIWTEGVPEDVVRTAIARGDAAKDPQAKTCFYWMAYKAGSFKADSLFRTAAADVAVWMKPHAPRVLFNLGFKFKSTEEFISLMETEGRSMGLLRAAARAKTPLGRELALGTCSPGRDRTVLPLVKRTLDAALADQDSRSLEILDSMLRFILVGEFTNAESESVLERGRRWSVILANMGIG
jgi:hypothetical protein